MLRRLILGMCLLWCVRPASAGEVTVAIRPAEGADFAAALGIDVADLERQLKSQIEEAFNVLRPGEYLTALTDAHAFSSKGLGVDYASNPKTFVFGIGGNISVSLGDDTLSGDSDRPVAGVAPNVAIMGGLNLGTIRSIGMRELTVYGNVFSRSADFDQLTGRLTNVGVHAQYKFFRPQDTNVGLIIQWGGFDVTTGLEYSRVAIGLEQADLETVLPVAGASQSTDVVMTSTGRLDLTSTAVSVPLEISTNWRLLYFASLFVGAGVDLQLGGADLDVALDGTFSGTDPSSGAPVDLGTAAIEATDSGGPSAGRLRFLGGVQANLWRLKLFVQGNVRPTTTFGVAMGARLAW